MSGLSEAELHVQAMRLVCEALQDREQDGLEVDWDVIRQMHDQMDAMLQALQHKHRCDSSEIVDLRKDRDHWKQARQDAHEAGELMKAEIETLRKQLADAEHPPAMEQQRDEIVYYLRARLDEERSVITRLRQQLDAANAAETIQQAEIERLHKFVGKARLAMWPEDLKSALAELDAGTEPTPVAEPARCPECVKLRAFVGRVRSMVNTKWYTIEVRTVRELLAELDAELTEPTSATEPLEQAEGGA